jgi:hypothetical protein
MNMAQDNLERRLQITDEDIARQLWLLAAVLAEIANNPEEVDKE